jgi:hypothetical protein
MVLSRLAAHRYDSSDGEKDEDKVALAPLHWIWMEGLASRLAGCSVGIRILKGSSPRRVVEPTPVDPILTNRCV